MEEAVNVQNIRVKQGYRGETKHVSETERPGEHKAYELKTEPGST